MKTIASRIKVKTHRGAEGYAYEIEAWRPSGLKLNIVSPFKYATPEMARRKAKVNVTKVMTKLEG